VQFAPYFFSIYTLHTHDHFFVKQLKLTKQQQQKQQQTEKTTEEIKRVDLSNRKGKGSYEE